ncbi:hypothetical protein HA402_011980, partial [Bradysia odoriphaga]
MISKAALIQKKFLTDSSSKSEIVQAIQRDGTIQHLFTATCEQEVFNNITYIVSPSFPALMSNDVKSCKLKIKMISPDISQLRLDFVHFSIGQPNRRTGICDGDIFSLTGGIGGDFMLCGQNNGQH